jgi:hypothetical protein
MSEYSLGKDSSTPALEQEDGYTLEEKFLSRLAGNLRQRTYTLSQGELNELKRLALLDGEAYCDYLLRDFEPKPVTYVSKGGYYVVQGLVSISLETGRIFDGSYGPGEGDAIELWKRLKQTDFYAAVKGLTEWLITLRERREWHRRSLCTPGEPINVLKELIWHIFEYNNLLSGEKVLFFKGNGERTAWIAARGLWKLVQRDLGEEGIRSKYFAAPHKFRELLDIWVDSKCFGRFRVNRRWRPKGVNLDRAIQIEYAFVPTGYPLDLPLLK